MTWESEILSIVQRTWRIRQTFTLAEMYRFEARLARAHPENQYVKAKIRQTLQRLRDERVLDFVDDNGTYRRRG
jgi:type II restriction enzyme